MSHNSEPQLISFTARGGPCEGETAMLPADCTDRIGTFDPASDDPSTAEIFVYRADPASRTLVYEHRVGRLTPFPPDTAPKPAPGQKPDFAPLAAPVAAPASEAAGSGGETP